MWVDACNGINGDCEIWAGADAPGAPRVSVEQGALWPLTMRMMWAGGVIGSLEGQPSDVPSSVCQEGSAPTTGVFVLLRGPESL